ncbi:MAG: sugar ABC transporter substrate-binding protein [Veillonellaceae bacterium]|nr:sugar ABC transporter substrate-binding protein [Veillonellaceae bacterium]
MKKIVIVFAAILISGLTLFGAGCSVYSLYPGRKAFIGISMPNNTAQRWVRDGENIANKLKSAGYATKLVYAGNDPALQAKQLDDMIDAGAKCLVITPVDSEPLKKSLNKARKAGVKIVSYDRLIMNTDAVNCYVTFDSVITGKMIGQYVESHLGLDKGKGPYNIEFLAGAPDDNNASNMHEGILSVLSKYIGTKQLQIPSGHVSFDDTSIARWNSDLPGERMAAIMDKSYSNGVHIDAVVSEFDQYSYKVTDVLQKNGYKPKERWPLITGLDGETDAARAILKGTQSMTVFKDTRVLSDSCVEVVNTLMNDGKINRLAGGRSFSTGIMAVPAVLTIPVVVDTTNLRDEMIESGYYQPEEIGIE